MYILLCVKIKIHLKIERKPHGDEVMTGNSIAAYSAAGIISAMLNVGDDTTAINI